MIKVSIIIPAYNGDRFITQAVESVLSQTYTNYEIIVVDDGSTDKTRQVLEPYLDKIQYLYQDNQGVAAARNKGIETAKGEFIAFLDQDDYFLPDKLALQISCFQSNPHIGMIHSGWCRVNYQGKKLGKVEPWHHATKLDLKNWLWWKPVLFGAMIFRRDWLQKVGGLDCRFKQVCDLDLVLRLTLIGCETMWLRQITLCYREHESNDSLNTILQAKESEEILDKFFSLPQVPKGIAALQDQCRYYTLIWIAWRLYYTGYLEQMANYLEKSFHYRRRSPTETVINWVECFKQYADEYGLEIDFYALSNSQEWQDLIGKCLITHLPQAKA